MDLLSALLSACRQPVPSVTVGVGLKGCKLLHVNDLYLQLAHWHIQIRINYPTDGTRALFPEKKKNEGLPLILVNVLFLVTPGAITEERIFWL